MHKKWTKMSNLPQQKTRANPKHKYTATCKNGSLSGAPQLHTLYVWTEDGRQPSHTAPENTAVSQRLLLSKPRPDIQLQKRRQYNWRQSFKSGRIPVGWHHHQFLQHVPLLCPRLVSCFLTIPIQVTESMKQLGLEHDRRTSLPVKYLKSTFKPTASWKDCYILQRTNFVLGRMGLLLQEVPKETSPFPAIPT